MTRIAAWIEGGKVYMGGDSAANVNCTLQIRKDTKVFKKKICYLVLLIHLGWDKYYAMILKYRLKVS